MKILFLLGSRGEWGYIRPVIQECKKRNMEYILVATNMAILFEYGALSNQIKQEGFSINYEIPMSLEGCTHYTMAKSLGIFIISFTDVLHKEKPDWVVLAGDRGEQLAGSIACSYTYTPCAHIQAGELSGNIDGCARHAIGKLSHIHFASNEDAAKRLARYGEETWRIHNVGAPQLDDMLSKNYLPSLNSVKIDLGLQHLGDYILAIYHPLTEDLKNAEKGLTELIDVLSNLSLHTLWILPNNDAGSSNIRDLILENGTENSTLFRNLKRNVYLTLLKNCRCLVGNSSCGIIEAPTYEVPAVNIGLRQRDRIQSQNVLNTKEDAGEIEKAISKALTTEFRESLIGIKNPYGDSRTATRIIDVLSEMKFDANIINKKMAH